MRRTLTLAIIALLLPCQILTAQLPGLPAKAAPAAVASPAADPLGRETPHGAIIGFLKAAQDENYAVATQYFQPLPARRRNTPVEEQDLAAQLLAVINQKIPASALEAMSKDPQGRLDDGLPPNQEMLPGVREFSIVLLRLDDERGSKLWYIARKSLDTVPEAFQSLQFSGIERKLPPGLTKTRFLSMPLWQWLAILVALPIAALIGWAISLLPRLAVRYYRKRAGHDVPPPKSLLHIGPGTLLLSALVHYIFVFVIGASIVYRQYYRRVIWIFLAIAFYWFVARITAEITEMIGRRLTARGLMAERSIVALARRVLEVIIFIAVGLIVLSGLGVNVTAALAGLGIGGLAIGLGAQKTFENLLGGISILTDKALQIGDACRIGDQRGTVEDIGLRSTKLRTEDRTVVTIPNGTVAAAVLENFRQRDKILFRQLVRLRYDLSADHLRYVLDELRGLLKKESHVENASSRVRLLRFADFAIEIEVYSYILVRDYGEFLELQEQLLLSILQVIEKTGAAIALSSQATLLTQDAWIDPGKIKAIKPRGDGKSASGESAGSDDSEKTSKS